MGKLSSTETQSVNYESNFSRLLLISAEPAEFHGLASSCLKLLPVRLSLSPGIIKLTNPLATRPDNFFY